MARYKPRHATKLPSDSERFYWFARDFHGNLEDTPVDFSGEVIPTDGRRIPPVDPEEMYDGRVEEDRYTLNLE